MYRFPELVIVTGVAFLYWKIIEKEPLTEMGVTKAFSSYFIGILMGTVLLAVSVVVIIGAGGFVFRGIYKSVDIPMVSLLMGGFVVPGGMFGVTLMLWICIQFNIFPPNFMSTNYVIFGAVQERAIQGFL